jgi:phosphate starvation-inducible PhoH-like protein
MANKGVKTKSLKNNDEFEITNRTVKDIEKRLNGIEKHPKVLIKEILSNSLEKFKYRNKKQKEYSDLIGEKEISIAQGPAGTGKSFLAVYKALQLLLDENNEFYTLTISCPAIEAGENIGFLPGNLEEKLNPYLSSTMYLIQKITGKKALDELLKNGIINIVGLGFIRGATYDHTIYFLEESQNTTISQMKTFLTRIGEHSKFIISGDIKQSDKFKTTKIHDSGLYFAYNNLKVLPEIGFFEFDENDIVRNPIIGKILNIFESHNK